MKNIRDFKHSFQPTPCLQSYLYLANQYLLAVYDLILYLLALSVITVWYGFKSKKVKVKPGL